LLLRLWSVSKITGSRAKIKVHEASLSGFWASPLRRSSASVTRDSLSRPLARSHSVGDVHFAWILSTLTNI
jgi:hypothetical protein